MEVGQKIGGRYKIIEMIGSGGMAKVYRAHDLILDRDVAVKVLRYDFQNDKEALRRFRREALAATELVHPNVVGVYDIGEDSGMQYIVMEYVRGMDLKNYIKKNFPISFDKVVDIMQQILSAVSLAHRHHIIHRDLKPQNILIDGAGNCKITDFGIAIALSETSVTQTNTLLGSVHYLSPEQARGSMATPQSDIYALGIILYELLIGEVPFDGESAVSIALKHFQNDIPSIREKNPRVPQALENVVLKATAKDPKDRYKTADAMSEDLSTVLSATRVNEPIFITPDQEQKVAMQEQKKEDTPRIQQEPLVEEKKTKKKKKKKRKVWKFLLSLFILILLIGGCTTFFYGGKKYDVPNVEGQTVEKAIDTLKAAHLKVGDTTYQYSDRIAKGKVIETDPSKGSSVRKSNKINLIVSKGDHSIDVGNYVGKDFNTVKKSLIEEGIPSDDIKVTKRLSSTFEKGTIIEQSPSTGTTLKAGNDKIQFVVSIGTTGLKLKDMTGMTESEARQYLQENELSIIPQYKKSSSYEKGTVMAQEPDTDSSVDVGDSIFVTFSDGQAASSYSNSKHETSAATPSNNTIPKVSQQTPSSVAPSVSNTVEANSGTPTISSAPTEENNQASVENSSQTPSVSTPQANNEPAQNTNQSVDSNVVANVVPAN